MPLAKETPEQRKQRIEARFRASQEEERRERDEMQLPSSFANALYTKPGDNILDAVYRHDFSGKKQAQ